MIRGSVNILCIVVLLSTLGTARVHANPDVWIKAATIFRFEDGKVTSIGFDWQFDKYFSSRTISIYDADQTEILETKEVERLREEAFDPLKKFNYYAHVWIDGEKRGNLKITNFEAFIRDGDLIYRFTVPIIPPADPASSAIVVSLFDKDIFVDFRFQKINFLLVEGKISPDCKFTIARGRDAQYGHPQPVTLLCEH